jgi:hypothetical protein
MAARCVRHGWKRAWWTHSGTGVQILFDNMTICDVVDETLLPGTYEKVAKLTVYMER